MPEFPQSYGGYELLRKIAGGASSDIFEAIAQQRDGPRVALKRLKAQHLSDPRFLEMLRSEADTLRACRHPNLVALYDYSEAEGSPFVALEYIDGISLHQLHDIMIARGSHLLAPAIGWVMLQIAAALDHLHGRGVLHTDLASRNILVGRNGQVKLIDFSFDQSRINLENTGSSDGWCPLIDVPPERARGEPFDQRADIFQWAAVFYWHLAGRSPFGDREGRELYQWIQAFEPEDSIFFGDWNPKLKALLQRCLAGDPNRRYASAAEVERTLAGILDRSYPEFNPLEIGRFIESVSSDATS